jgi:hypothetical protein
LRLKANFFLLQTSNLSPWTSEGGSDGTKKLEEVPGTAEIAPDSDWASNDSAGNGFRLGIFWSAKRGLAFILEKMWESERITPFLPGLMGSSNMGRRGKIKNR